MPIGTTALLVAGGLALGGAGLAVQYSASQKQAAAQKEAMEFQKANERKREQQMNLDAMRRQREIVRNSIAARSQALTATTAAGASTSSAIEGAYGGISGRSTVNSLGVSQNLEIGSAMFANNRGVLNAYQAAADAGALSALGSGLSSLGNSMIKNEGAINRVGTYFFGR